MLFLRLNRHSFCADVVVMLAIVILVVLFSMQRSGTTKVSFMFAPVVLLWFVSVGFIGVYNIIKYDPTIFRAVSPAHVIKYFSRNKKAGWSSLGGIVLSITG